jgi:hypothetical protein
MSDEAEELGDPLPAAPVQDQSADQPKRSPLETDAPYNQDATDDPQEDVPDNATETDDPQDDVFNGEEDEAAREEIEKSLLTNSDNSPTAEDGEQPSEVENDT